MHVGLYNIGYERKQRFLTNGDIDLWTVLLQYPYKTWIMPAWINHETHIAWILLRNTLILFVIPCVLIKKTLFSNKRYPLSILGKELTWQKWQFKECYQKHVYNLNTITRLIQHKGKHTQIKKWFFYKQIEQIKAHHSTYMYSIICHQLLNWKS